MDDAFEAVMASVSDAYAETAKEIAAQLPGIVAGTSQDVDRTEKAEEEAALPQVVRSGAFRPVGVRFISRAVLRSGTSLRKTAADARLLDPTTGIKEFRDLSVLMAVAAKRLEEQERA